MYDFPCEGFFLCLRTVLEQRAPLPSSRAHPPSPLASSITTYVNRAIEYGPRDRGCVCVCVCMHYTYVVCDLWLLQFPPHAYLPTQHPPHSDTTTCWSLSSLGIDPHHTPKTSSSRSPPTNTFPLTCSWPHSFPPSSHYSNDKPTATCMHLRSCMH